MARHDHLLLSQVAEGNEKAFRELFEQYSDSIYGAAFAYTKSSLLAEEIVQEVFLKVWNKKESLPGVQDFPGYIFIIARNRILNVLRRRVTENHYLRNHSARLIDHGQTPEQEYIFKESKEILNKAVLQLPPRQRVIYQLIREQGLKLGEAAEQLGLSRNTVRNQLAKAMGAIRSYVRQHADEGLLLFTLLLLM